MPLKKDFNYQLPDAAIAYQPSELRGGSKLLVWEDEVITHEAFNDIDSLLPKGTTLVFNNTKVIEARLKFYTPTNAGIEVFLLAPILPSAVVQQAMEAQGQTQWRVMVGNGKKWKDTDVLTRAFSSGLQLTAKRVGLDAVSLTWLPASTPFAAVLQEAGNMPLPPYIKREATPSDAQRYQTVYAKNAGAVAAPTAGLHFTPAILDRLDAKGVHRAEVTLHVSAGTFLPVKDENIMAHTMHSEQINVNLGTLKMLAAATNIVAVGTTSLRTLESLYWVGVRLLRAEVQPLYLPQFYDIENPSDYKIEDTIAALIRYLDTNALDAIEAETAIMIVPGYKFRVVKALITNFHQPESTLIMLIAAFIGEDKWRLMYQEALANNYKFLSYGDSSLLFNGLLV